MKEQDVVPLRAHVEKALSGSGGVSNLLGQIKKGGVSILLPPAENQNRLSGALKGLGASLGAINIFLSIIFIAWTYVRRKSTLVRYSQAFFLGMIAFGCMMSSSSIFLGFEDSTGDDAEVARANADKACMVTPWLYSMGFVMSFAPLFL